MTLIDTPGFDDTSKTDTDILKLIASFLEVTCVIRLASLGQVSCFFRARYKKGFKLSGVIFVHRISDMRMGGIAKRNFHMFRKLCGDGALRNVVIVTNMWGLVESVARGEARERELSTDPELFQPALSKGAMMLRHDNTIESAHAILSHLINNRPDALRIQKELVDEGKNISQTGAGQELDRVLLELMEKHEKELADVRKDMVEALAAKDREMQAELKEARKELMDQIQQIKDDRDRLAKEYDAERKAANARLSSLENDLEQERQQREARQTEISDLRKTLQESTSASSAERARMQQRIDELEQRGGGGGGGWC